MKIRTTYIISFLTIIIGLTSFSKKEKSVKTFYKNGKLESEFIFDNKCNCKKYLEYYENGKVRKRQQYSTLGIDGTDTIFFLNGKPNITCEWKDGIKVGKQIAFYEDGKTAYEETYENGYKEGTWKYLDTEGMLFKTIEYADNLVKWNSDIETTLQNILTKEVFF